MSEFLWRLEISREAQMSAKSSEVWQKRSSPVRVQKRGRREHGLLTLCFNLNHKCDIALIYRMSTNQILIDWLYQSHFYQSCDQSTARALLILSLVSVISGVSRVAQMVKNLPAMRETQVRSLDRDDSLEKGMATRYRFPGGSAGKASAHSAGDPDSIPGSGRSPGEGNDNLLRTLG